MVNSSRPVMNLKEHPGRNIMPTGRRREFRDYVVYDPEICERNLTSRQAIGEAINIARVGVGAT
jgi:hypothetical protein